MRSLSKRWHSPDRRLNFDNVEESTNNNRQNHFSCHTGDAPDANNAFTLVELLVVVVMVGLLGALQLPVLAGIKGI
jgi:prepilin-type N-terminal cleavage/methylation domain-containing protein